MEKKWHQKSIV